MKGKEKHSQNNVVVAVVVAAAVVVALLLLLLLQLLLPKFIFILPEMKQIHVFKKVVYMKVVLD